MSLPATPYAEDLVRSAREFTIEAYVPGAEYTAARDRIVKACAAPGPGLPIHPCLGVICNGCHVTERTEEGRVARLRLSFVEAGVNTCPAAAPDSDRTPSPR